MYGLNRFRERGFRRGWRNFGKVHNALELRHYTSKLPISFPDSYFLLGVETGNPLFQILAQIRKSSSSVFKLEHGA
jgi:hypothetical protein